MLKISRNASVILSLSLAVCFMFALVVTAFFLPEIAGQFLTARHGGSELAGQDDFAFVLTVAYGILAVCLAAAVMLVLLLRRVRLGHVFTAPSVTYVRLVSWCAILMGLLFGLLAHYFRIALAVAFAGIFLGLCVRVVKNVIEEATAIKEENDLTV